METESQWIFDRMRLYKLWQAHPDWSLGQFGQALGYDKGWVRKWLARFQTSPDKSWRMFLSQSRAPKHCPTRISDEVKQVIGELREELSETFYRRAGGRTILYELLKRDDLKQQGYIIPQSASTINKILKELGYMHPKPKRIRQLGHWIAKDLLYGVKLFGSVAKNLLQKVVGKENSSCSLSLGSEAKDLGDELILCLILYFAAPLTCPFRIMFIAS